MLTKSQLMKVLVDIATVNDVSVLDEERNLPIEICAPEDRQTVRRMAALMADLLRAFVYESSLEFERSVAGKSSAVVAMKRRLASDPVKRSEQQRRLECALGEILSNDDAYALVTKEDHGSIRSLVELASRLRNPSG